MHWKRVFYIGRMHVAVEAEIKQFFLSWIERQKSRVNFNSTQRLNFVQKRGDGFLYGNGTGTVPCPTVEVAGVINRFASAADDERHAEVGRTKRLNIDLYRSADGR